MSDTVNTTSQPPPISNEVKVEAPKQSIFVLYYRAGSNPHPMTKYFTWSVTIHEKTRKPIMQPIVDRSLAHCQRMNYRFIRVVPFMSSLDYDERFAAGQDVQDADD